MQICQPLGFYFPGTVLCVDDNARLLEGLQFSLPEFLNVQIETNPTKALEKIKHLFQQVAPDLIASIDDSDFDQELDYPINVYISKIVDKVYNPQRFRELTVLVVDQSMPGMNGVELCEELRGHPCKKIMLTGETGNALAIEAFNKGLIDHFIAKADGPDLMTHLESAVNHLEQKYFQERSALILGAVSIHPCSFLNSPFFLEKFNQFLKNYHICEFYLLDTVGSFLGVDCAGKPYWFLVRNIKQMDSLIEIAASSDADPKIIKNLRTRDQLVYCLTSEERNLPIEQWDGLTHPVSERVGDFFIAIVEGAIKGFDAKKASSFKSYLANAYDAK